MNQLPSVLTGERYSVKIPGELVPGFQTGGMFSPSFCQPLSLPERGLQPVRERRKIRFLSSLNRRICTRKQPWITEAASADHHTVAAGIPEHPERVMAG